MEVLNDAVQRFQTNLGSGQRERAARDLGVSQRALRELGCGNATDNDMRALAVGFAEGTIPPYALTFPERDENGAIIGVCFRAADRRKGTAAGSKRGLVYSALENRPDPVLIVEGPTDAAAGTTLFLTTIGRASSTSGAELIAALPKLAPREVLVVADSDGPGVNGAKALTQALANRWKRPVRWTTPPDGHKDTRAYLLSLELELEDDERCAAAGERLLEAFRARAQAIHPVGLTQCIADIESRPVKWLLPPCVPLGKLGVLAGHPGLGKSLVTVDMAAHISRGEGMHGERPPAEPADVLFLSAEDDPGDTIRPRLEAASAVLERVHFSRCLDIKELARMLDELPRVRFVVIDPLSAYVGHVDTHNDSQVRTLLAAFAELASTRDVAILFVAHLKKSEEGDAIMRPGGSVAFVAAARIAWIILKDPADEQRRYFLPIKNNLGADALGFAYRIGSNGPESPAWVAWEEGRVAETANGVLARKNSERSGRGEASKEAQEFLREQLGSAPVASAELFEAARARGISKSSLKRAGDSLGVRVRKRGMKGGWEWALPPRVHDGRTEAEGDQVDADNEV